MNLVIKGKNMEVPENVKAYIEKKIGKVNRYLNDVTEAKVELSHEMTKSKESRYVVEITLDCKGTLLRGEKKAADVLAAIDTVADTMDRQIRRYKERRQTQKKRHLSLREASAAAVSAQPQSVVRVKQFAVRPMSVEEAIDQMELLGHDFFVFANRSDAQLNVVYRRKGGSYGLIRPESE